MITTRMTMVYVLYTYVEYVNFLDKFEQKSGKKIIQIYRNI